MCPVYPRSRGSVHPELRPFHVADIYHKCGKAVFYKIVCKQGAEGRLANASFDVAEYDDFVLHSRVFM